MTRNDNRTALITGASRGLGKALAEALTAQGWNLILTARGTTDLESVARPLNARYLAGDVTDAGHRAALAELASSVGGIDLLVNNASTLGAFPLPSGAEYPLESLDRLFTTNVIAPMALMQLFLPGLRQRDGAIVNISSDAATGAYPGWSGYGATKAALDQVSNVVAAEETDVRLWWVDPGEMHTRMLTEAVGAQEAATAPPPESVAPVLAALIDDRRPSGRYTASRLRDLVEVKS